MGKDNSSIWSSLETSFFQDLQGKDPKKTPPAGDYKPQSSLKRQILNLLFVIDVSGSMTGTRIAQVNYALENIFKELRFREDLNSSIKVGIMEFSNEARWLTPRPIPLEDYVFTRIQAKTRFTSYGQAFLALEEKLHSAAFMNPDFGDYYAPVILFITDGEPMDLDEYPTALNKLKANKWFSKSAKYAIAVGEEAKNIEIGRLLAQFTGVIENVRYADEGAALCNLIEFIAVRASEVQTSSIESGRNPVWPTVGGSSIFSSRDESLFDTMFDALS